MVTLPDHFIAKALVIAAILFGSNVLLVGTASAANTASKFTRTTYTDGGGTQQGIDIYSPATVSNTAKPAIVFIHGGGWRVGDKSQYASLAKEAVNRGYVAFSINYRLITKGIDKQYDDVGRAVRFIQSKSTTYGINANKIVVWGDSAGANLALRLAGNGVKGISGAVSWSGPTDAAKAVNTHEGLAVMSDHANCLNNNGALFLKVMQNKASGADYMQDLYSRNFFAIVFGGYKNNCKGEFAKVSVANFAKKNTPPTFLISAEKENLVRPDQSEALAKRLKSLGVKYEVKKLSGSKHMGYDSRAVEPSFAFGEKYFKK